MIDNSTLPTNRLIAKLNAAAEKGESLELSVDEVELAAKEFGGLVMIPVYSMGNIPKRYLEREQSNSDID